MHLNQCTYQLFIGLVLVTSRVAAQDTNAWHHWTDASSQNDPTSYVAQQSDQTMPKARLNAASFSAQNGDLYLFGGFGGGNATFTSSMMNDMWKFSTSENVWTYIGGSLDPRSYSFAAYAQSSMRPTHNSDANLNFPGARHHSCFWTGLDGSFWVWGGYGFSGESTIADELNDMWRFDVHEQRWSLIPQNGLDSPAARHGASSWVDADGNFWFFGGRSIGHNAAYFNDVWKFDVKTGVWESVSISDTKPSARYASAVWKDASGDAWIFGGFGFTEKGTTGALNDMWKLGTENGVRTWKQVTFEPSSSESSIKSGSSSIPPACYMSSHWVDEATGQFRLYGGTGLKNGNTVVYFDHIWGFNPLTATWELISASSGDGTNSVAKYTPQSSITSSSASNAKIETVPGARSGAAVWTDGPRGQTWIFGGEGFPAKTSVGLMNDLWTFGRQDQANPILCPFGKVCKNGIEIDSEHVVVSQRTKINDQDVKLIGTLSIDAPLSMKDASVSVASSVTFAPSSDLEISWTYVDRMTVLPIHSRGEIILNGKLIVNIPADYVFSPLNDTIKAKIDLFASGTKISGKFESVEINLPDSLANDRKVSYSAEVAYSETSFDVIISKQARKTRGYDHFMIYWVAGSVALCVLALWGILKSIDPLKRKYEDYKARRTLEKVILVPKLPDFSPPPRK